MVARLFSSSYCSLPFLLRTLADEEQAMSDRVCFLPIITHALSHSFAGRVRSATLKDKILRLQGLADSSATSPATTSRPIVHSLSDLVNAKLWKIVRLGVYKEDAGAELKPLTVPAGSVSEIGDANDQEELEPMKNNNILNLAAAARQSQSGNDDNLARLLTRSPQLIGNLNVPYQESWDGGLLAQPVNVHHILAQLGSTQYTVGFADQYDHDMSSLLSDDDNDDGLLSSEANADDAMISEAEEISSIIGSHQDEGSILSDSSFNSFMLDDNRYDDDETPQTSQESAVSHWIAGRTVDELRARHQQPVPPMPMWQPALSDIVDYGGSMIQDSDVDEDYLISGVDKDDEMLDDWADDYDMLE